MITYLFYTLSPLKCQMTLVIKEEVVALCTARRPEDCSDQESLRRPLQMVTRHLVAIGQVVATQIAPQIPPESQDANERDAPNDEIVHGALRAKNGSHGM